jgi:hypothetical protein
VIRTTVTRRGRSLAVAAVPDPFVPGHVVADVTRFDADDPDGRRKLFAEGIRAARERGGPFVTFESHAGPNGDAGESGDADPLASPTDPAAIGDGDDGDDGGAALPPWIQFSEGVFNLDCTDEELDRLKGLLEAYPSFRIDELNSPEETEGTNVRVTARSDENRLAGFVDDAFREVYGLPEDYRAWVTEL